MKHHIVILSTILASVLCAIVQPLYAIDFDPNVRYSQEMINARMSNWYNKDSNVGFPNEKSTSVTAQTAATWDYVPGVVAKGILDVWEYYQDEEFADAWYNGLKQWAVAVDNSRLTQGGSLDDLNCAKVFFGLYDGAKQGAKFADPSAADTYKQEMTNSAIGLADHKIKYSIQGTNSSADGGWYHKSSYTNQMWCDGAYMGPALLAQILAYDAAGSTGLGWNDVMTQFTASWNGLWDNNKKLLWHCFSTDKSSGDAEYWYYEPDLQPQGGGYHSAEYWGRANGWYILALVDVLEAMEKVGKKDDADFNTLKGYLQSLSDGLVARQDAATGCWYQLLQYGADICVGRQDLPNNNSGYSTDKYTNIDDQKADDKQCNYLESSASCLISAALLKGSRLGYINHAAAGKKGYEGIVKQFVVESETGYDILASCQSAGLGINRNGTAAYYLIGRDVSIQNNCEGKVLGAFLMTAVEYERAYIDAAEESRQSCNCLQLTLQPR